LRGSIKLWIADTRSCLISGGKEIDKVDGSMSKPIIQSDLPKIWFDFCVAVKFIPELEKLGLLSRIKLSVRLIWHKGWVHFIGPGIIHVMKEVGNILDMNGDPSDQTHEHAPYASGAAHTKFHAVIDIAQPINSDDLFDLPERVYQPVLVRAQDVIFEEPCRCLPISLVDIVKNSTEILEVIKAD
jgi:hypothetical protein